MKERAGIHEINGINMLRNGRGRAVHKDTTINNMKKLRNRIP